MDLKSKIVLIYGPTASGKSKFAVQLAKKINGEIINADSMQVYKELKILSARPSQKDYQNIKHHLYGFQSVKKSFSTGDWLKLVNKKILELKKRKKVPIIVGGTGLYFKALTNGLVSIPNIPVRLRNKVRILHKTLGSYKFYNRLQRLDPSVRNKLKVSDTQRVIRAYEIKLFTKKSIFQWFKKTQSSFSKNNFYKIVLDIPKDELLANIGSRIDKMIKLGAIAEIKKLIKMNLHRDKMANKALGVEEIKQYLKKEVKKDRLIENISIKTRQYAKRQKTWARGQFKDWNEIKVDEVDKFLPKII
mgnify:FL=1